MSNTSLVADRLELTDAQIVAELNALTVRKTNSESLTWKDLLTILGPTVCGQIDEILKLYPGLGPVQGALSGPGIDLSRDLTQSTLEALRPKFGAFTDQLKAIGVWNVSPWKNAGNANDVTVEEVAAIRAQIASDAARSAVESKWVTVQNEIVNPMVSAGNSWAEIKAAIAEVE